MFIRSLTPLALLLTTMVGCATPAPIRDLDPAEGDDLGLSDPIDDGEEIAAPSDDQQGDTHAPDPGADDDADEDPVDTASADLGDTGGLTGILSDDLSPDSEPRRTFVFTPDSSYAGDGGYAMLLRDAVQDGGDDFDNVEFTADFGDSGAATLELEVMLNCAQGAAVQVVDVADFTSVLVAECGPFRPVHGELEHGHAYLAVVSADGSLTAPVDYDLSMVIRTVF